MSKPRVRILTFNDPQPLRIDRNLAQEIGFLESVILLQLEYLVSISTNERDGLFWTYNTLKEFKATHFPWLSQATISRTLTALENKHLIVKGNFNKVAYDRTIWYTLDYEGLRKLKTVKVEGGILQNEKWSLQDETSTLQKEDSILQSGTTIPKSPQTNSQKTSTNKAAPPHPLPAQETSLLLLDSVVVGDAETLNAEHRTPDTQQMDLKRHSQDDYETVRQLTLAGIIARTAQALVGEFGSAHCRKHLNATHWNASLNPPGALVDAIRKDWSIPTPKPTPRKTNPIAQSARPKQPGDKPNIDALRAQMKGQHSTP